MILSKSHPTCNCMAWALGNCCEAFFIYRHIHELPHCHTQPYPKLPGRRSLCIATCSSLSLSVYSLSAFSSLKDHNFLPCKEGSLRSILPASGCQRWTELACQNRMPVWSFKDFTGSRDLPITESRSVLPGRRPTGNWGSRRCSAVALFPEHP